MHYQNPNLRWSETSSDPNSPGVLSSRRSTLAAVRAPHLYADRIEYLCKAAAGKKVLDIGVVEHFREASESTTWLHQHLCRAASSCVGIDILEDEVKKLQAKGFKAVHHDITSAPLNQRFDLIVVGDVIEHLNSPASLFAHAAVMLEPGGRLILTTPNPWYLNAIVKNLFEGAPFTDSADHVAWFDGSTLCELAGRHGLYLAKYAGIKIQAQKSLTSKIVVFAAPLLMALGIRREVFAKTMVYEFAVQEPANL